MDFPWMDKESRIKGSIEKWRATFPCARAVNLSRRNDIVDADFVHIRGEVRARLHIVNISMCSLITDAAFVHLRGIHTLNMSVCSQATITTAAIEHLRGIRCLDTSYCSLAVQAAATALQR